MSTAVVRRALLASGLLLAVCGLGARGAAQTRTLPAAPGTWKVWKPMSTTGDSRQSRGATPAMVKAFETELVALNTILRRAQGVAAPVGFSVETWGHLDSYPAPTATQPAGRSLPLAGGLTFGAFPIFEYERAGKMIREDTGETALMSFNVNELEWPLYGGSKITDWGSVNTEAFLQPVTGTPIAGLPRYGDALVIAKNSAPLWIPLPFAAALDVVAMARHEVVESYQESVAAVTTRLAGLRDPTKRAARLASAKAAAATMPNGDAFLAQMQQAWKIEEDQAVLEIGPTGGTGKGLAESTRALNDVTSWLADTSPADRAAPACYVTAAPSLRGRFRHGTEAGCVPIVTPNYKVFNATAARSAAQVVLITPIARCFDTANTHNLEANSTSPAGCSANRKLVQTMDVEAIKAWLK